MGKKLIILQGSIVGIFAACFVIHALGMRGALPKGWIATGLYPTLHRFSTFFTDLKFRWRGAQPTTNDIVILDIDSTSIENLGRWPWRRDYIALLIDGAFQMGAKYVGLDILFSEPQQLVPDELAEKLRSRNLDPLVDEFDVDQTMVDLFRKYGERLILPWHSESACQPRFHPKSACPVSLKEAIDSQPQELKDFAINQVKFQNTFVPDLSPVISAPTVTMNIKRLNDVSKHVGFVNGFRDPDGLHRRAGLVMAANGRFYPSLALQMATAFMGEKLSLEINSHNAIASLKLSNRNKEIPILPTGLMEINLRGPERTFPYISALDVITYEAGQEGEPQEPVDNAFASTATPLLLKDSLVLIGMSALALGDIVSTPFESHMPGVEVHATILDNLISQDALLSSSQSGGFFIILILMLVGTCLFSWQLQRLEAYPSLALFGVVILVIVTTDIVLFAHEQNWNYSFLYLELILLTSLSLANKYINEEQNKKFLRTAFSTYVAPTVVQSIVKDPSKLSLGGRRETLSILFSDIRSFSSFSETLDAKVVAEFLNDYLGLMTDTVFKYGGTLDKYIGDAVMAFWGAPLPQQDHALRACLAAREMIQIVDENRERYKKQYGITLRIGIGVHTGEVNVGNLGSARSFDFTVIGDNVNLTSRLEAATKDLGASVLTTQATLQAIEASGNSFEQARRLGPVRLKGKENNVEIAEIICQDSNLNALSLFEQGRMAFMAKDFKKAETLFQKAAEGLPNDKPCQIYLETCHEMENQTEGEADKTPTMWHQLSK